jgi:hypothetical protein
MLADARVGGGAVPALAVNADGRGRGSNRVSLGSLDGLQHIEPPEGLALEMSRPVQDLGAPDIERLHPADLGVADRDGGRDRPIRSILITLAPRSLCRSVENGADKNRLISRTTNPFTKASLLRSPG